MLFYRLETLGRGLLAWSKEKFGKLSSQISKTEKKLLEAQQKDISDENCLECTELEKTAK